MMMFYYCLILCVSSDGVTKVQSDSLSSDPPQAVKTKEATSASVISKNKSPVTYPSPQGSPCFHQKRNEESSSTTLSNSIPGIRPKELHYPLDKYLPRLPKREDTFVKSREPPLRKEVALFRKIESLLKDSQCMREPILNCAVPSVDVQLHDSTGSRADRSSPKFSVTSLSTEDLVAAEFYKATYGTPKKTEGQPKSNVVIPPNRGAGDWVVSKTNPKHEDRTKHVVQERAQEHDQGRVSASPFQWDCLYQAAAASPKSTLTESYYHQPNRHTVEPLGQFAAPNDHYENVPPADGGLVNVTACEGGRTTKLKFSDAYSVSSGPSASVQTSCSRPHKARSPLKRVTMQNASINTDRLNTHVFSIKHAEPEEVADDFAHHTKSRSFVVQELPKVNIRTRLVKQNCGIININPVSIPKGVQNTVVVEMSHDIDEPQPHDEEIRVSPRKTAPRMEKGLTDEQGACASTRQSQEHFKDTGSLYLNQNDLPSLVNERRQPAVSHKFAFDRQSHLASPAPTKPKIFSTIDHFKEKLSKELNFAFEPIKRSLTEMVGSLNDFCEFGLNDVQTLQNLSSTSKANPQNLRSRVEQLDDILTDELKAWGQRDATHYNLLRTAIDELTNEIKTAVQSFVQQQSLNKRMQSFLEGSIISAPKDRLTHQDPLLVGSTEAVKVEHLFAIDSLLQHLASISHFPTQHKSGAETVANGEILAQNLSKRRETFILPTRAALVDQPTQVTNPREDPTSQSTEQESDKGAAREEYEDDFIPEDPEQLSESDLNSLRSTNHTEKNHVASVEPIYPQIDDNVVHLRTSGNGNGIESTEAPVRIQEDPPLSTASTINASQANVKTKLDLLTGQNPIIEQQRIIKSVEDRLDKPIVRLTNKHTNAVFELRLPEQLENLSSTITYNSIGCNDEIKLSIGSKEVKDNVCGTDQPTTEGAAVALNRSHARPDGKQCRDELMTGRANSLPGLSYPPVHVPIPMNVPYQPGYFTSQRTSEIVPPVAPRVTLKNQATQFPSDELNVESLSANLLSLFESKMNEMVENSKQKLTTHKAKCCDFNVQVSIDEEEINMPSSQDVNFAVRGTTVATPAKTPQKSQPAEVTPVASDDYDSHPRNLERPSDFLLFQQTEKEMERMLKRSLSLPVQMESSPSSMSLPTSLSDFPRKRWSSSSSELAFPLGSENARTPFNTEEIRHLRPAPGLTNVHGIAAEEAGQASEKGKDNACYSDDSGPTEDSVHDVSAHLHPNPDTLPALQPTPAPIENGLAESYNPPENSVRSDIVQEEPGKTLTCQVYDMQPYDSDLMSEGEIGYICTSNSYSSGEIVEKKKRAPEDASQDVGIEPTTAVRESEMGENGADPLPASHGDLAVVDDTYDAVDSPSSNEGSSCSETTSTTESS